MRFIFLSTLFILCLAVKAEALPLANVHMVVVSGTGAIQADIPTLFAATKETLKPLPVRLRLRRSTYVSDSAPGLSSLAQTRARFDYWKNEAIKRHWFRGSDIVHVALPPIIDPAGIFVGELALTCGRFSVSFMTNQNNKGESRYEHSLCSIGHGLLHNLGSGHHNDSINLMHSDALRFVSAERSAESGYSSTCRLPIEASTVKEVEACR